MMPVPPPVDPARCPLCGGANACLMAADGPAGGAPQAPCWCTQVDFSPALRARVPPLARGRACICHACATADAPAH